MQISSMETVSFRTWIICTHFESASSRAVSRSITPRFDPFLSKSSRLTTLICPSGFLLCFAAIESTIELRGVQYYWCNGVSYTITCSVWYQTLRPELFVESEFGRPGTNQMTNPQEDDFLKTPGRGSSESISWTRRQCEACRWCTYRKCSCEAVRMKMSRVQCSVHLTEWQMYHLSQCLLTVGHSCCCCHG